MYSSECILQTIKIKEVFNMKEVEKKNLEYEVVKGASFSTKEVIETVASDVGKSRFISLRDACTCTGNCYSRV